MSIFSELTKGEKSISVTGLGYVGLPLALEFAKHFKVIGYDNNEERIAKLKKGIDPSGELGEEEFRDRAIEFTSDPEILIHAHFHIVSVTTDIDEHKVPDLRPLLSATATIGRILKPGDYVIYESTVYPGCTEEDCVPLLEAESGLSRHMDFKFGYSPERIVPGEKVNTLTNIKKIVSGSDEQALEEIAKIYGLIIKAGLFKAGSVKVAEAAKVTENIQRDINISLMNELAIIFDRLNIDTNDVIEAASSKWNFQKYTPGLVGGHCIGVDPYYLIHKAKQLGHDPQVIAAGRRVNDYIPSFIAKKVIQALIEQGKNPGKCKVLVMGITFKENVSDIRNSKVVELIKELGDYSLTIHVQDPRASAIDVKREYNIDLTGKLDYDYDAVIIAVGHSSYKQLDNKALQAMSNGDPLVFDIKGIIMAAGIKHYWKL